MTYPTQLSRVILDGKLCSGEKLIDVHCLALTHRPDFVLEPTSYCAFSGVVSRGRCGGELSPGETSMGRRIDHFASLCETHISSEGFKKVLPCSNCEKSGSYSDPPMKASLIARKSTEEALSGQWCIDCRSLAKSNRKEHRVRLQTPSGRAAVSSDSSSLHLPVAIHGGRSV